MALVLGDLTLLESIREHMPCSCLPASFDLFPVSAATAWACMPAISGSESSVAPADWPTARCQFHPDLFSSSGSIFLSSPLQIFSPLSPFFFPGFIPASFASPLADLRLPFYSWTSSACCVPFRCLVYLLCVCAFRKTGRGQKDSESFKLRILPAVLFPLSSFLILGSSVRILDSSEETCH